MAFGQRRGNTRVRGRHLLSTPSSPAVTKIPPLAPLLSRPQPESNPVLREVLGRVLAGGQVDGLRLTRDSYLIEPRFGTSVRTCRRPTRCSFRIQAERGMRTIPTGACCWPRPIRLEDHVLTRYEDGEIECHIPSTSADAHVPRCGHRPEVIAIRSPTFQRIGHPLSQWRSSRAQPQTKVSGDGCSTTARLLPGTTIPTALHNSGHPPAPAAGEFRRHERIEQHVRCQTPVMLTATRSVAWRQHLALV